jgi:hypothetical protein
MWLKPHVKVGLIEDDFNHFTIGDMWHRQPRAKRRRLSDITKGDLACGKLMRHGRNAIRRGSDGTVVRISQKKRKNKSYAREKQRLNQLWIDCTKDL